MHTIHIRNHKHKPSNITTKEVEQIHWYLFQLYICPKQGIIGVNLEFLQYIILCDLIDLKK